MIVADTNVVSEFMKSAPHTRVLAWAQALDAHVLAISVVTVEEVERGIARLPASRRRLDLGVRWRELADAYADNILVYDSAAARSTAQVLVSRETDGRPMSLADAQIAGTCLSRRCELATRNARGFSGIGGLTVVNPFG